ncbi:MAG TPA: PilZ domain-containing protein [Terriglobales bacterium]|nr:PilZ domain-containing protein [Terriglobales bacterium]
MLLFVRDAMVVKVGTHTAVVAKRITAGNGSASGHRVTLAGLEVNSKLLLKFAESFKAFNFDCRPVAMKSANTRHAGAITACVLPLNQTAVTSLRKAGWFLPRRTLLYGIGDWSAAARFCDLGINALLERTTDLCFRSAVSTTRSVISHGIGEYARVPIVTTVIIQAEGLATKGITRNVGPGGMAVTLSRNASLPADVHLEFSLPGVRPFSLRASPRWYSGVLVGLRFQPSKSEKLLRKWISEYSRLGKQA